MKISKKLRTDLEYILLATSKTQKFIRRENTVIAYKDKFGNGLSFYNKKNEAINELNKFCGSDLQYLDSAITRLHSILTNSN